MKGKVYLAIKEIINYKNISEKTIDLFLPESFEWLILKSDIFSSDPSVKEILQNPVDHIESAEFISWERFFTYLLSEITKDKSKLPSGYLTDANIDSIINAMNNKKARRRRAFFISSSLNLALPNPSFILN